MYLQVNNKILKKEVVNTRSVVLHDCKRGVPKQVKTIFRFEFI